MTQPQQVFKRHAMLSKMDGKQPIEKEVDEAINHPEFKFIFDAMIEYAKMFHEEQSKLESKDE